MRGQKKCGECFGPEAFGGIGGVCLQHVWRAHSALVSGMRMGWLSLLGS